MTIRASVADMEIRAGLAVVLVVIVVLVSFAFSGTIISKPIGSAVARQHLRRDVLLGFSLDDLSLMALTIATSFVVDDAIVMIENIARFVEGGMDPLEAALRASGRIGFTVDR